MATNLLNATREILQCYFWQKYRIPIIQIATDGIRNPGIKLTNLLSAPGKSFTGAVTPMTKFRQY